MSHVFESFKNQFITYNGNQVSVAQWIAHQTSNLGVVGSSPIVDGLFFIKSSFNSFDLTYYISNLLIK